MRNDVPGDFLGGGPLTFDNFLKRQVAKPLRAAA